MEILAPEKISVKPNPLEHQLVTFHCSEDGKVEELIELGGAVCCGLCCKPVTVRKRS